MSTTATPIRSWDLTGRRLNVPELLHLQLGRATLMRIGARDILDGDTYVQMTVSRGQKLIITLLATDLFAVERVRKIRGSLDWTSEEFVADIDAENIRRIVEQLGDV